MPQLAAVGISPNALARSFTASARFFMSARTKLAHRPGLLALNLGVILKVAGAVCRYS